MGSLRDAAALVRPRTDTDPLCLRHCPSPSPAVTAGPYGCGFWPGCPRQAQAFLPRSPCPLLRFDPAGGRWFLLLVQPSERNQTVGSRNKNPPSFTGCTEAWLGLPKRLLLVLLLEALGPGAVALKDAVCKQVFKSDGIKYFPARGRLTPPAA